MTPALRFGLSLRTRLTLWYGALLAATLVGFGAVLSLTLQQSLASGVDDRLSIRASQVRRDLGPNLGSQLQPEDVEPGQLESALQEFVAPGIYVQLLNRRGAVLAAPPNLAGGELPVPLSSRQALEQDHPALETVPVAAGDATVRLLTVPLHNPGNEVVGGVQVAESLSPLQTTMAAVYRLLLLAGLGALALALAVGWLLTRAALSPVARITATARHIAQTGDYSQRLLVGQPRFGRGDELFFLASTFNDMIARLEHLLEAQRRLLADTSHELRNPITIVRGNLALLKRPGVPEPVRHEAVVEAEEEAARMGRLVADLLLLARADAGEQPAFADEPVDLAELAAEVVEQARPAAGARRLDLAASRPCLVRGDRDRLKQVLANLVENALRYTPAGGRVSVRVACEGQPGGLQQPAAAARSRTATDPMPAPSALVEVSDTGIGISPTDLPHLFERFYRADKARSRASGGSGLGLSIAHYLVQAHGGTLDASSDGPNRGSRFRVRLPLLAATAPEAGRPAAPRAARARRLRPTPSPR